MLNRIKLKNFRAFSEEVDIRIRPITILIGRNSAGKSTLIKFLLMLQQTLEASEGEFFSTEGRHVSLGHFGSLKNSNFRSNNFQFTLELETTDLPEPIIQQIREDIRQSKTVERAGDNDVELKVKLKTSASITTQEPLKETSIKVVSAISASQDLAKFCISGSIPYRKSTRARHTVTCKIREQKVLKKEETNIRRGRTRFLNFSLPNNPVDILKTAFDNLYLDGVRYTLLAMRHLSPVREESERTVILGSPPPDDVGHRGEYAMPHLQTLLDNEDDRAAFVLKHIESVIDVEEVRFEPPAKGFVPEFKAKNKLTGAKTYLADFGFGVSQCIPIFVQGALMNPSQLLIVEQPEAQIHPTAQLSMGSFFANLWKERKVPSLIETHSSNIILRLRRLVAQDYLKSEEVSVAYFYVENQIVKVKNLEIKSDGSLEKGLPMEFFGADVLEALEF